MEFMPMRSLSQEIKSVVNNLRRDGELVITNNGKPAFLMIDLSSGQDVFSLVHSWRRLYAPTEVQDPPEEMENAPLQQLAAFNRFITAIDEIDDEPISDADFALLENNRPTFSRGEGLW